MTKLDKIKEALINCNYSPAKTKKYLEAQGIKISSQYAGEIKKKYFPKKINKKQDEQHVKPQFDKLPTKKVDIFETLSYAAQRAEKHNKGQRDYSKIVIKTDKPIAIIKAADLHFGGLDVSYQALLNHIKFLFNNDNFYLQLFGDEVNLMVMHRTVAARHDIFTPNEQVNFLESLADELLKQGKLLSMSWGNHDDEFTERVAGFGIVNALMKYKVPYFNGTGYIDLKVGKITYPMGFVHKTRFNSFMNPLHGNKRMQQMHVDFFGPNLPICREYITAHTHNPAIACEGGLPEDRIWYIKCGTFKTNDAYSRRYFGRGRIGCPTVVYFPDHFEHICFPTPYEAYRYMKGKDYV